MQKFLKKADIAQLLQVTTRTVDNLVGRGVLPIVRIGRIVRFPAAECEEAIQRYTSKRRGTAVRQHSQINACSTPEGCATQTTKGGRQ